MHILEDSSELSARAQDFLRRVGRREVPTRFGAPIELWLVHDQTGRLVPAPMDLVIRCEGFEQKYGGLRYDVRRNLVVNGELYKRSYQWEYNHAGLSTRAWQDNKGRGWYFEWAGEHVSKPCRDLIHTDGSVGTDVDGGGSPYLPLAPSIPHLIESHALTDTVAPWTPWPIDTLATKAAELLDNLVDVSEASWGTSRWQLSQTVAVLEVDGWDRSNPRRRTRIWSRDDAGHREVRRALERARQALDRGEAAAANSADTKGVSPAPAGPRGVGQG